MGDYPVANPVFSKSGKSGTKAGKSGGDGTSADMFTKTSKSKYAKSKYAKSAKSSKSKGAKYAKRIFTRGWGVEAEEPTDDGGVSPLQSNVKYGDTVTRDDNDSSGSSSIWMGSLAIVVVSVLASLAAL